MIFSIHILPSRSSRYKIESMKILVCNDDGINAEGITSLALAAQNFGEVEIIAPKTHQSAKSHSLSLDTPLTLEQIQLDQLPGVKTTSIAGTPVDCIKLAIKNLLDYEPDLVLSGINAGANVGVNVLYSGTIAAAAEAAMLGIPAIALSADKLGVNDRRPDFKRAQHWTNHILEMILNHGITPGMLLNVNIPTIENVEPRGIQVCHQSDTALDDHYIPEKLADDSTAYRLANNYDFINPSSDSDIVYLRKGFITITPLQLDLTNIDLAKELDEAFSSDLLSINY